MHYWLCKAARNMNSSILEEQIKSDRAYTKTLIGAMHIISLVCFSVRKLMLLFRLMLSFCLLVDNSRNLQLKQSPMSLDLEELSSPQVKL